MQRLRLLMAGATMASSNQVEVTDSRACLPCEDFALRCGECEPVGFEVHGQQFSASLNYPQEELSDARVYQVDKIGNHARMSRRQKTRQQNLKTLLVESGMKKKEFAADVLDCTPSYFSQLIRPTKPKPINDKYAAKAEGYFGRPIGWLDWPPDYVPNEVRDGDIPEYVRRRFAGLPEEQQQRVLRAIDDVITLAEGADFRPQDTVVWRNIKRVDEGREPKKKAKAHRRKK